MNDRSFTKLFSCIVTSSMWSEDCEIRVVWITMLALANSHGEVLAAIPGLARAANVPLEVCEKALNLFQEADKYSRTSAHEGRRIERIEGGWKILNYSLYRRMMSEDERREYMRDYMDSYRKKPNKPRKTPVNNCKQSKHIAEAEAEAEAEADKNKGFCDPHGNEIPVAFRTDDFLKTFGEWHTYKQQRGEKYKPMGAMQCLSKLVAMGSPEVAAQSLKEAMANNWQGFFPPKNQGSAQPRKLNNNIPEALPGQW